MYTWVGKVSRTVPSRQLHHANDSVLYTYREREGGRGSERGGSERGGLERIAPEVCAFVYYVFLITPLLCLPINKADSNAKGWFDAHCLPWSDAISKTLDDQGVEFVEDLKILNRAIFSHLFMDKKTIVKTRADISWKELGGRETFQVHKISSSIPIKNASTTLPKKDPKTKPSSHSIQPNGGGVL